MYICMNLGIYKILLPYVYIHIYTEIHEPLDTHTHTQRFVNIYIYAPIYNQRMHAYVHWQMRT